MICTFCNKSASKLVTQHLCDCCLGHLNCSKTTAEHQLNAQEKSVPTVPEDDATRKIECDFCLGEYQEEELLQHREMCTAQLVFRCAFCHQDYVSKEGLWKHLNLHEVTYESKQLRYQEMRVTYILHKCILCNDQRGYQESLYWQHIHEDHDGFFLRCSECGENFRSQKLLTDHTVNLCKAREQTVPSGSDKASTIHGKESDMFEDSSNASNHLVGSDQEQVNSQIDENSCDGGNPSLNVVDDTDNDMLNQDSDVLLMNAAEEISQPLVKNLSIGSSDTKCTHCSKECFDKTLLAHHIKYSHTTTECDSCGIFFTSSNQARYHKLKHHTEPKHKCPHCSMKFHQKHEYQHHLSKHLEDRKLLCEICGQKFKDSYHVAVHMRRTHHMDTTQNDFTDSKEQWCQKQESQHSSNLNVLQDENIAIKEEISVEETSLQLPDFNGSGENFWRKSSSITQCPICMGSFGDEDLLCRHVEGIHQLYICVICGIVFASADQIKDHKDQQHSSEYYNGLPRTMHGIPRKTGNNVMDMDRDVTITVPNHNIVSRTESIGTIKARTTISLQPATGTVATVFSGTTSPFEVQKPTAAIVYDPNRAYFGNEDVPNYSSFDGWEIHSTVPIEEIESHVLKIEFGFRFKSKNVPAKGKMQYYDCRRIKCRVIPQCDRKLLVFIPNTGADATVSLKGKHTCATAPPADLARAKLNEHDCELIGNLLKSGLPSRDVKKHFRVVNSTVSNNQLNYAVKSALETVWKW